MKKILCLIIGFLSYFSSQSQPQFWGMTSSGGKNNGGVIFNTDSEGNNLKVNYQFTNMDFNEPMGYGLIKATDGMLYGTTSKAGVNNEGVLFQYNPATHEYTVKYSFKKTTGSCPSALIQASDGMLYGITHEGGKFDKGVIFQYNLSSDSYAKKFDFSLADGTQPLGSLTQGKNGMLYGITNGGGINDMGVLFQYNPATSAYLKKIEFKDPNKGYSPNSPLMEGKDGKLYGLFAAGGKKDLGVLFQYNPVTNAFVKKFDFDSLSGYIPYGALMQASDGIIYGTASSGGKAESGVIFQFNPLTDNYVKMYDFDNTTGRVPLGALFQLTDGMLYGFTMRGGDHDAGIFFKFDPSTSTLTKKFDMGGVNGSSVNGKLVQANDGMFYGTTFDQPLSYSGGTLFKFNPVTATVTTEFKNSDKSENGRFPFGSLMQASDGRLYGLTSMGGANDTGVLFQYDPLLKYFSKKFDFGNVNGSWPIASLMQAKNGMLYGMTVSGGTGFGGGVLFQYDPATVVCNKKINFTAVETGNSPFGTLMQATDGMIYGMTDVNGKGPNTHGILFQYNPSNETFINKFAFDFDGPSGNTPTGALVETPDGMLYGLASRTGRGYGPGVLFQYNPLLSQYTKKIDFDSVKGISPTQSLLLATDGMLYGLTSDGGAANKGTLFQYNPSTSVFTKKIDFDGNNGSVPRGSLMQASNGMLYGTTNSGGTSNMGVLFQYNPQTSQLIKKLDFNGTNGAYPNGNLIEIGKTVGIAETVFSHSVHVFPNPTTGVFNLKIDPVPSEMFNYTITSIEITSVLGKKVSEVVVNDGQVNTISTTGFSTVINLSGVANGIYFLTIKTDKQQLIQKIVKNN